MSKAVLIYSVDDYRRNHDRPGKQYPLLGQVYTTIPCIVEFIYNYLYILGMRGFRPVADVSSSSHSLLGSLSLSLYISFYLLKSFDDVIRHLDCIEIDTRSCVQRYRSLCWCHNLLLLLLADRAFFGLPTATSSFAG